MNKQGVEEQVKLLEKQITDALEQAERVVGPLKTKIRELRLSVAGVSVGDVVVDLEGKEYRVTVVDPQWSKAWVEGNQKKKDGTFGIARRMLFSDWTIKEVKK